MVSNAKQREARAARERTRQYQARQTLHTERMRRRGRDNVVAGVVGGILLAALIALQTAYFVAGPGAHAPAASPAPTSSASTPAVAP